MTARNEVIEGKYVGEAVASAYGRIYIKGKNKHVYLDPFTVRSFVVPFKSFADNAEKGIFCVSVQFKSGENSLLEVDENIYKTIIRSCR